jgi:HJR/Mrr/RecB family endonuclease
MNIQYGAITVLIVINIVIFVLAMIADDIVLKQFLKQYLWTLLIPWLIIVISYVKSKKDKPVTVDDQSRKEKRKEKAIEEIVKMREERMQREWNNYFRRSTFSFVNKMAKFIDLIVRLLKDNNYFDVRSTADDEYEGIDILCMDDNSLRVGILVQKASNDIGPQAVEQLIGSMNQYGCSKGKIAAISEFTFSAIKLAKTDSRIELWDRNFIEKLYYDTIPAEIPPFSMEKAKQLGLTTKIRLTKIEKEILFRKYGLDYSEDFGLTDIMTD